MVLTQRCGKVHSRLPSCLTNTMGGLKPSGVFFAKKCGCFRSQQCQASLEHPRILKTMEPLGVGMVDFWLKISHRSITDRLSNVFPISLVFQKKIGSVESDQNACNFGGSYFCLGSEEYLLKFGSWSGGANKIWEYIKSCRHIIHPGLVLRIILLLIYWSYTFWAKYYAS